MTVFSDLQGDGVAGLAVARGVVEELSEDLGESVGVGQNGVGRSGGGSQIYTGGGEPGRCCGSCARGVHGTGCQSEGVLIGSRYGREVVDESGQTP